jgi:hypothetical protein
MSEQTISREDVATTRSSWPVFAVCATAFFIIMFDLAIVNGSQTGNPRSAPATRERMAT